MLIEVVGKLNFKLENKTKKHFKQDWKKTAAIMLKCDTDDYYAWFISKRFGIDFNKTLRGAHITIISDRMESDIFEKIAEKYHDKPITFYHELEPRTNNKHWWLRIHCPLAEEIRKEMGLTEQPYFGFHLTIGYVNELQLEHSKYIFDTIKRFNILSSEPKQHMSKHEIIKFNEDKISTTFADDEFKFNDKMVYYRGYSYIDDKNKNVSRDR